jgi:hypothetical protein
MKPFLMVLVLGLAFASCKRQMYCSCTISKTYEKTGQIYVTEPEIDIEARGRKDGKKQCDKLDGTKTYEPYANERVTEITDCTLEGYSVK